ncbi:cupredoxin domain-containing protein [Mesorhizobium sp. LHD-90]|uniref:cupredoxin domain-containing protein n=1 Tax=Mesorhizobium sp. LHD-90 TaxID=3071414 RepID=UPI0027E15E96|nr:cupredoxin domain-containing protein [Mesorhizobium sp. LHD-90]MDQ6433098.1 cupredoxin domain-containing protein [Mesorhizobium sp. LHD-90]
MTFLRALLLLPFVSTFLAPFGVTPASFAGEKSFTLTIHDHRFKPQTLRVPAGEKFSLVVVNADPTAEEFESNDFHVEKVIGGGKQMTFHVGPLTAGEYGFFGERHMDSALGRLFAE